MSTLALNPTAPTPTVVLSYGLGVDSTAILLRWLHEPASRPAAIREDLTGLVVVTAMTGDEWADTGRDVTAHVLPLLRAHGVRYVQAARSQRLVTVAGDGVVVLADTTHPEALHLDGSFKLSDELRSTGTVPQTGGARLCSVHAKGDVLDPVIETMTRGHEYLHAVGFEANEPGRAIKDATYNTDTRTGVYPLIEWGWDREACIAYIASVTGGIAWDKSACSYCPFALSSKEGRARVLPRYAADVDAAVNALMIEHVALALNPAQKLMGKESLVDLLRSTRQHGHVLDAFAQALEDAPHAVYEVRRVLRPKKADPTKLANADRAVRRIAEGTRSEMLAELSQLAEDEGAPLAGFGIQRVWLRERGASLPAVEHLYVVAPAVVDDKQIAAFDARWPAAVAAADAAAGLADDQLALAV